MDPETARQQFPFYDDMQAIFTSRMQMMLWTEAEGGGGGTSGMKKKASGQLSSDEEEEYINEEIASEELLGDISNPKTLNPRKNIPKKRKGIGGSNVYSKIGSTSSSSSSSSGVREVLEEFMRQQLRIEREWREAWEVREKERAEREAEWRRRMEELENERASVERMWREKEEQRRAREEARAEKRDALINALLTKLTREGSL